MAASEKDRKHGRSAVYLSKEPTGCTFVCMATPFLMLRFRRFTKSDLSSAVRTIAPILLALVVSMSFTFSASARPAKDFETATLVEAAEYIPCADACSPFESPASAFCFRLGDEFMVGEEKSFLREPKSSSTDDLSGKKVPIRFNGRFIWVRPADGAAMKLKRGSLYEGFKARGCIAEVHKPILAHANTSSRSVKIPDDAIAIAGSGRGDFQPLYLWFECIRDSDSATIACQRWYGNGDSNGKEWYCSRTMDGTQVGPNFAIDPLQSQAGRLVLTSGTVLQFDSRARTNDKLDRPSESCR